MKSASDTRWLERLRQPEVEHLHRGIGPNPDVGRLEIAVGDAGPGYSEANGEISPDGRWIAYDSNESGSTEVYVRPFPDVARGRWQISAEGGSAPEPLTLIQIPPRHLR